jgi:hypothetical protein
MPSSAQSWTVSCRACDLVIGAVEDGRFVHDPMCTRPLAIGAGLLRCCQCGGRLDAEALPFAATEEIDEAPAVHLLRFVPMALREDEARKRL